MPEVVAPIVPNPSPIASELYLRGLALVAATNAKKNANEIAIQRLQNQLELGELKHQTDMERMQNEATHYADMYQIGQKSSELKDQTLQLQKEKVEKSLSNQNEDTQRLIDMQSKIYAIPAKRGTTDYQKQLDDIKDQYSDITGSAEAKRIISPLEQQHKTARLEGFKAFNNQVQSLGIPSQYAPAIFATPEMWQQKDDLTDPKNPKMKFQIGQSPITIPKATYDKLKPKYREYYDPGSATVQPDTEELPKAPIVKTKGDYDTLPSGTIYVAPDGSTRTKP